MKKLMMVLCAVYCMGFPMNGNSQTENTPDKRCLTKKNFMAIVAHIQKKGELRNPEDARGKRIAIHGWDISYEVDGDRKILRFSKTGRDWTLGSITLENGAVTVYSTVKEYKAHEKIKSEITGVFCDMALNR